MTRVLTEWRAFEATASAANRWQHLIAVVQLEGIMVVHSAIEKLFDRERFGFLRILGVWQEGILLHPVNNRLVADELGL